MISKSHYKNRIVIRSTCWRWDGNEENKDPKPEQRQEGQTKIV